jgi:hypothetical protein
MRKTIYPFVAASAALGLLIVLTSLYIGIRIGISGRADFRCLYAAGYLVRTGDATRLFDYDTQRSVENDRVSVEDVALPFNHAPYEALLFAPLSLLSYRSAYVTVLIGNLCLLALSFYLLRGYLQPLRQVWSWLPEAIFACSIPVTIALFQSQDSILLFTLISAAFVLLDRGQEATAGALVSLSLFKFQYAIPILLLFVIWRRWKFVAGFTIIGAALAILSFWLVGTAGLSGFIHLLSTTARLPEAQQNRLGEYPGSMPNLRGLFYVLFHSRPALATTMTALASTLLIFYTGFTKRVSLPLAVSVAVLASYHATMHDLTLTILPAGILLGEGLTSNEKWKMAAATALLVLPVLVFLAGPRYFYLLAVAILAMIIVEGRDSDRTASGSAAGERWVGQAL